MKIPFLDMRSKVAKERDAFHAALDRVLDSGVFILGPEVTAFEKELAVDLRVEAANVVSCNSGTDALVLALRAFGVGDGDEVVVPAHTAVPTVTAIRSVGALPRFADVNADTWVLDPADALAQVNKKTKAVIAVHLYGNSVDLEALAPVRDLLMEDVAQAQGGFYGNAPLGTWGRAGAYSFYPTKNLGALGDGGAMVFRDPNDAARARALRFYGQSSRYVAELDHGINSRLDEVQAAFLRVRLSLVREELAAKQTVREWYERALAGLPLRLQAVTPGSTPAWHLLVASFESEGLREKARIGLEGAGIGCLIHYPTPNHLQAAFREFKTRSLPVTENLSRRILSLPFHPGFSLEQVGRVAETLRAALGR
jgi:dTDP-3-amino-3,4,6-trideoxy-alpha-D-glucose transaminase